MAKGQMTNDKIAKATATGAANCPPNSYRVLREHGTERAGTSPLNHEKRPGEFLCAGCGAELFDVRHQI